MSKRAYGNGNGSNSNERPPKINAMAARCGNNGGVTNATRTRPAGDQRKCPVLHGQRGGLTPSNALRPRRIISRRAWRHDVSPPIYLQLAKRIARRRESVVTGVYPRRARIIARGKSSKTSAHKPGVMAATRYTRYAVMAEARTRAVPAVSHENARRARAPGKMRGNRPA